MACVSPARRRRETMAAGARALSGGTMSSSVLVVVDVQERLFNAMDAERREEMVANVKILVSAARRLGVPEGTVKSRTHYALRALRLALEEMGVGA